MNGEFEYVNTVLCTLPNRERRAIFQQSLTRVASEMSLRRFQEAVSVNNLGIVGISELMLKLCLWAEREDRLDELFLLGETPGEGE